METPDSYSVCGCPSSKDRVIAFVSNHRTPDPVVFLPIPAPTLDDVRRYVEQTVPSGISDAIGIRAVCLWAAYGPVHAAAARAYLETTHRTDGDRTHPLSEVWMLLYQALKFFACADKRCRKLDSAAHRARHLASDHFMREIGEELYQQIEAYAGALGEGSASTERPV